METVPAEPLDAALSPWYTFADMVSRMGATILCRSGQLLRCLMAVLVLALPWSATASRADGPAGARKTATIAPADLVRASRSFSVVLQADTPSARVRGLQGFRALLPGEAALFVFDPPQQVSFWMASLTYPIDIIYIDASGVVSEVFPECQPESQAIFTSAGVVRWVLEITAGSGVRAGDRFALE